MTKQILFIAIGGALGAVSRYIVSKFINIIAGTPFPMGTLIVNLIGSFVAGILYSLFLRLIIPIELRNFILIGYIGAFTTFATYTLESSLLLKEKEISMFIYNIFLSNFLGILTIILGLYLGRIIYNFIKG